MSLAPVRVTLTRDRSAPRRARDLLREHEGSIGSDRLDTAVLLISELVTNAVVHGRGAIQLTIEAAPRRAHFEVSDEGGGTPAVRREAGPDGGWGLQLVDQLAARWGVRKSRTLVWFDL